MQGQNIIFKREKRQTENKKKESNCNIWIKYSRWGGENLQLSKITGNIKNNNNNDNRRTVN